MKPQAFAKLDLLAAAKEAALLDRLNHHNAALRRYETQREVLASYQERLGTLWRGGGVVRAGDAIRAGHFSTQAEDAMLQLSQAIGDEQMKLNECTAALAELRAKRRILQERLGNVLRLEKTLAQERAARDLPHKPARLHAKTETAA